MQQINQLPAGASARVTASAEREQQILQHLGLVHYVAGHFAAMTPRGFAHEDLVAFGTIGLIQAIDRFEPERGCHFASFAVPRIRGAILDAIQLQSGVPRRARARAAILREQLARLEATLGRQAGRSEVAATLGANAARFLEQAALYRDGPLSLDAILEDPRQCNHSALASQRPDDDVAASVEHEEDLAELRRIFPTLGQRDQAILQMVYAENRPVSAIAVRFGISQGRVSQLRDRALKRLRAMLVDGGPRLREAGSERATGAPRTPDLQVA